MREENEHCTIDETVITDIMVRRRMEKGEPPIYLAALRRLAWLPRHLRSNIDSTRSDSFRASLRARLKSARSLFHCPGEIGLEPREMVTFQGNCAAKIGGGNEDAEMYEPTGAKQYWITSGEAVLFRTESFGDAGMFHQAFDAGAAEMLAVQRLAYRMPEPPPTAARREHSRQA